MEALSSVYDTLYAFVAGILTNPYNVPILVFTWGLVEAVTPLIRLGLASKKLSTSWRLKLYDFFKKGKRFAAIVWCLGFVWIPQAQPPLCADRIEDGCQTIIGRLAVAVVLGLFLSLGHNFVAKGLRKVTGKRKLHGVICAHCTKAIKIETLEDPCSECGKKPLAQ